MSKSSALAYFAVAADDAERLRARLYGTRHLHFQFLRCYDARIEGRLPDGRILVAAEYAERRAEVGCGLN